MLQAVLQPRMGDGPPRSSQQSGEHHVEMFEKLAGSTLDWNVKVSAVIREAHRNSETICCTLNN